jgi:hypothetical protein
MKKLVIAVCCSALLWTGCKENDAPIFFSTTPAVDSTYKAAVVATEPHNVLIEEFTGQSCSNCPSAHAQLDAIAAQAGNEGRINIVSMYIYGGPQTFPPAGSLHDFRDSAATQVSSTIYGGVGSLPSGGIDRSRYNGNLVLLTTDWSNFINAQKAVEDSLNLDVTSSYTGGVATIKVTVTYTKDMASKQNISVYITEDGITDKQESGLIIDDNYLFKDIFRGMITNQPLGDAVLDTMAVKPAGQVYWRKYTYTPDVTKVNPANCKVVAFVSNPGAGGDFRVLQSKQVPLKP